MKTSHRVLNLLAIATLSACGDSGSPGEVTGKDGAPAYVGTEPWYVLNAILPEQQPYGLDVYTAKCLSCHGDVGQGVGSNPAIQGMTPADMQKKLLAYRDGRLKGTQATAKANLSDAEIAAVSIYAGE